MINKIKKMKKKMKKWITRWRLQMDNESIKKQNQIKL